MRKTFSYRIFPTKKQEKVLNTTLEECRWLYNHFLEERRNTYKQENKSISLFTQEKTLSELKRDRPLLKSIHSQVLQEVAVRVDLAFKAFFRRFKAGEKPGYPRFKGIGWYDSFTYPQSGFKVENNKFNLSKIGSIKIKLHRPIDGIIKTCTVKRQRNKWYTYFSCEVEFKALEKTGKIIGIDMGLESFVTLSNGEKIQNRRFFKTDQKALKKAQRKLSKQNKGTPERKKTKKVIARIHERIANRRNNFSHQVSRKIINQFDIICIEDLRINQMQKNNFRSINRSISDVAWGQFAQYLSYKAESAGRKLIRVNPAYTSQTCSRCGNRHKLELSDRVYHCPSCGLEIDRDINASLNILRLGTQSLGFTIEAPSF